MTPFSILDNWDNSEVGQEKTEKIIYMEQIEVINHQGKVVKNFRLILLFGKFLFPNGIFLLPTAIIWLISAKELKKRKTKAKYLVEESNLDGKKEPEELVLVQFVTPTFEVAE